MRLQKVIVGKNGRPIPEWLASHLLNATFASRPRWTVIRLVGPARERNRHLGRFAVNVCCFDVHVPILRSSSTVSFATRFADRENLSESDQFSFLLGFWAFFAKKSFSRLGAKVQHCFTPQRVAQCGNCVRIELIILSTVPHQQKCAQTRKCARSSTDKSRQQPWQSEQSPLCTAAWHP